MSKDGFIKVTVGLTELMRMGDTLRCLSNGRKRWEAVIQSRSMRLQGYTHATRGQRYNTLEETNGNKINAPS
jgi:hypothetical protein